MKFRGYLGLILIALHVYYVLIGNSDFAIIPITVSTLLLITSDLPSIPNLDDFSVDKLYDNFFIFIMIANEGLFILSILNLKSYIFTTDISQFSVLFLLSFIYLVVSGELTILYYKSIVIKMLRSY